MNFLELALGKGNQFWKYLVVLVVSFVGASIVGSIPLAVIIGIKMAQSGDVATAIDITNLGALGISSNLGLFLMMLPLVLGLFVLVGLIWLFHSKRSYKETINGTKRVRWNRVAMGAACWASLMFAYWAIDYALDPSNYVFQFDLSSFIPLIIISLLLIPLQTSFEELSFRGYFAQGMAALTKNRWAALIVPSVIFGLIHITNPEVKEFGFWIAMPQYILFGMVFGLVSILDDGIELAMGVHAANNVFLSLFITHSSSALQTSAIFSVNEIDPVKELVVLSIMAVVLVLFFYKKYNWSFSVLNKKVEKKIVEEVQ